MRRVIEAVCRWFRAWRGRDEAGKVFLVFPEVSEDDSDFRTCEFERRP